MTEAVHVVIPDTQAKYGVPTAHLGWVGRYIAEKFGGRENVKVIHLGDHWDMPSLSSYDRKGGRLMEGRRFTTDIEYGNRAWEILQRPILDRVYRGDDWQPELHYFHGNHEARITRAVEQDAQLEGLISLDQLAVNAEGIWQAHDFLRPVKLDGVTYAHYFANPNTGRPYSGQNVETRLKTVGYSFSMGHQQGLKVGIRDLTNGERQRGLVAGSCYLHDEDYAGPQGNHVWRGILVCYNTRRGDYDLKEVSLDSLCRRYEGKTLAQFRGRH